MKLTQQEFFEFLKGKETQILKSNERCTLIFIKININECTYGIYYNEVYCNKKLNAYKTELNLLGIYNSNLEKFYSMDSHSLPYVVDINDTNLITCIFDIWKEFKENADTFIKKMQLNVLIEVFMKKKLTTKLNY